MTLERVLNKAAKRHQPLSEPFAASAAAAVADALHHAHSRADESGKSLHLIHRGVSPRTLQITERGGLTLRDFGAVRAAAPGAVSTDRLVLKGEVEYAAPELLRAERSDGRADVFSLGLVLVEMLTLQHLYDPPRQARPPRLRGFLATLRGRLRAETPQWGEPAKLAERAASLQPKEVAHVLAQVSAPLREIILRSLRVNPEERYPTAAALRDDLRAFLQEHHPHHGAEEIVREVRQVVTHAAREHGDVQTSEETIPAAFKRLPTSRH
jgi:serine/threonine-protein kinase